MTSSLLIIQIACFLIAAVVLTSGVLYLLIKPRIWSFPPTNLIVLAAHPDDCVVISGEYALWALAHGMKVDIVYFTSGSDDPASSRAKIRACEAFAAWHSVGVSGTSLHFLGYGQSPMNGACLLGESELDDATDSIKNIVLSAQAGTAIFVPAAGETHVDHRTIRRIGLKAISDSGRKDLLILEAPEYNSSLSLARSPDKVVQYVLKTLPLIWRFGGDILNSAFPGFICGRDAGYIIDDAAINSKKKAMLRYFVSEDGGKLVRHFGYLNQFRPVTFPISPQDEKYGIAFVRIGKYRFGLSVIGLWFSIYLLTIGFFWQIPEKMTSIYPGSKLLFPVCGILVMFLVYASNRARKRAELVLLYGSGIVGIIGGLIASFG